METPRVLEIQIAEKKGLPMKRLQNAKVIATGLEGDRYATGKGAFSQSKRVVDRHISLIESEAIYDVRDIEGLDVTFADTRRNLLTVGLKLNDLVGKRFFIGEVLVEGVELCDPCGRPGLLSGKDDVRVRFKDVFDNRGGLRVKIIGTGDINEGDSIRLDE